MRRFTFRKLTLGISFIIFLSLISASTSTELKRKTTRGQSHNHSQKVRHSSNNNINQSNENPIEAAKTRSSTRNQRRISATTKKNAAAAIAAAKLVLSSTAPTSASSPPSLSTSLPKPSTSPSSSNTVFSSSSGWKNTNDGGWTGLIVKKKKPTPPPTSIPGPIQFNYETTPAIPIPTIEIVPKNVTKFTYSDIRGSAAGSGSVITASDWSIKMSSASKLTNPYPAKKSVRPKTSFKDISTPNLAASSNVYQYQYQPQYQPQQQQQSLYFVPAELIPESTTTTTRAPRSRTTTTTTTEKPPGTTEKTTSPKPTHGYDESKNVYTLPKEAHLDLLKAATSTIATRFREARSETPSFETSKYLPKNPSMDDSHPFNNNILDPESSNNDYRWYSVSGEEMGRARNSKTKKAKLQKEPQPQASHAVTVHSSAVVGDSHPIPGTALGLAPGVDPGSPYVPPSPHYNPGPPPIRNKLKPAAEANLVPLDKRIVYVSMIFSWIFWIVVFTTYYHWGQKFGHPAEGRPGYYYNKPLVIHVPKDGSPAHFNKRSIDGNTSGRWNFARVLELIDIAQITYDGFDWQSLECQKKVLCELAQKNNEFGETGRKITSTFSYVSSMSERYLDALEGLPMPKVIQQYLKEFKDAINQGRSLGKDCGLVYNSCKFSIKDLFTKPSKKSTISSS